MKLQLDRAQVQALVGAFPALQGLSEQLRFGHRIEVSSAMLPLPALEMLADLHAESADASAHRGALSAQLRALVAALRSPPDTTRFAPGCDLELLLPALLRHLMQPLADGRPGRGWLFAANTLGKPLAWVATRVDFVGGSSEENAKLMVELKAHAKAGLITQTLRLAEADLRSPRDPAGATVAELLAAKGFLKESPELLAAYDATAARYGDWRGRYGALFNGSGMGFHAEDPNATHRDTDWSRKDQVVLAAGGGNAKLVNDESILPPRGAMLDAPGDVLGPYLRKAAKSSDYGCEDEAKALQVQLQALGTAAPFTQLPVHAYLFMFHLELHQHLWVHVDDMAPRMSTTPA